MQWRWLALGLILAAGCKSADKGKGPSTADAAGAKPKHWLEGPSPGWAKGDVPKAGSWSDPRDPKFDYTNYVKGSLSGYVLDANERPTPTAVIVVESADPSAKSLAPVTVLTDANGAFVINGLKPGETYTLTAKMKDGGTLFAGQTYATPPSVHVRIRLKDSMALPNSPGFGSTDGLPGRPSADGLPPMPGGDRPAPAPLTRDNAIPSNPGRGPSGDRGWSPISPTPKTAAPSPDDVLPLPSATAPSGTGVPDRPDLNTRGPKPEWKPPVTDLPSPPPTIAPPPPTIAPPPGGSDPKSSTSKKLSFALLDPAGRSVELPDQRSNDLILLDFMTTTCLPCKKAIPTLIEFQRRYGVHGVQLLGVVCDDAGEAERRSGASAYQREFSLNYLLYTEAKPQAVRKLFGVDRFPTLVLLDGQGTLLWKGHPNEMKELEKVIRATLSAR